MTQTEPEFDEGTDDSTHALREARAAADRGAAAIAELDQAKRENAMLRALPGVDISTPLAEMFVRSYQGELEVDAIKAAATAVGVLAEDREVPAPPPAAADIELDRQRAAIQGGAVTTPVTDEERNAAIHPRDAAMDAFTSAMKSGESREKASEAYFDHIIGAAVHGDQRALWKGYPVEAFD